MEESINRRRSMGTSLSNVDYSKQYFTIVSLSDDNVITWKATNSNGAKYIMVSTNKGNTWSNQKSTTTGTILATLNKGERLMVRNYNTSAFSNGTYNNYFASSHEFDVEGNIMSMATNDDFTAVTTVDDYMFRYLFWNCEHLISAENLVLPATTLGTYCYNYMFCGCSSMTKSPKILPAMTLKSYCYAYMFLGCSSMTTVPELPAMKMESMCYGSMFRDCTSLTKIHEILPATTLAAYCYNCMYYGCSNITTSPVLEVKTLLSNCYRYMFYNCSKLNKITCLATDKSASNCTATWVAGVASSGTFIKDKNMSTSTWGTGNSGIPTGWIVEDYKLDITNATVIVEDQSYTGSALTPSVTVELNHVTVPSNGYTVTYSNNTNVGTATVVVTGIGDYKGEAIGNFLIVVQQTGVVSFPSHSYSKESTDTEFTVTATKNGDGDLIYSSSDTNIATVNSNTGKVTMLGPGNVRITATMTLTARDTTASDYYDLTVIYDYAIGTVTNFAYTGTVQSVLLVPGTYKLQCWGAQGGSNQAYPTYNITLVAGGNGGYSEGQLTISSNTTLYAFVGGQGSSVGNGGWNGGGGTIGTSSLSDNDGGFGMSSMGCGGGGTDFALTTSNMDYVNFCTDRSTESLNSRIIVAGGGSGGAMAYYKVTNYTYTSIPMTYSDSWGDFDIVYVYGFDVTPNCKYRVLCGDYGCTVYCKQYTNISSYLSGGSELLLNSFDSEDSDGYLDVVTSNNCTFLLLSLSSSAGVAPSMTCKLVEPTGTYSTGTVSYIGYGGGGIKGLSPTAYNLNYGFGCGTSTNVSATKYQAGSGGGGWFGGLSLSNDINYNYPCSSGGSGFVNIASNASYRPSGYTGLQLDSGTTKDASTLFEAPTGGNERGHTGNGYARITRLS